MYQMHLITSRYSQLSGIDFSENYSLVVNKVTFHVLLLMILHFGYLAKIVNIEIAFLYGDLEEELYMECLQGMSDIKRTIVSFQTSASTALFMHINIIRRMLKS